MEEGYNVNNHHFKELQIKAPTSIFKLWLPGGEFLGYLMILLSVSIKY